MPAWELARILEILAIYDAGHGVAWSLELYDAGHVFKDTLATICYHLQPIASIC